MGAEPIGVHRSRVRRPVRWDGSGRVPIGGRRSAAAQKPVGRVVGWRGRPSRNTGAWVAAAMVLAAGPACSEELTWDWLLGGDFYDPLNWSPQEVPVAADTLYFDGLNNPIITVDADNSGADFASIHWSDLSGLMFHMQGNSVYALDLVHNGLAGPSTVVVESGNGSPFSNAFFVDDAELGNLTLTLRDFGSIRADHTVTLGNANGATQVTLETLGALTADFLYLTGAGGVAGSSITVQNDGFLRVDDTAYVGTHADASLIVQGGIPFSGEDANIGRLNLGGDATLGTFSVDGSHTDVILNQLYARHADIDLTNGATVTVNGFGVTQPAASVGGAIGTDDAATVNLHNNATLDVTGDLEFGVRSIVQTSVTGNSQVLVTGTATFDARSFSTVVTTFDASALDVGHLNVEVQGSGFAGYHGFTLQNGSTLNAGITHVRSTGDDGTVVFTLTGAGTTFTNSNALYIEGLGQSTLEVLAGAVLDRTGANGTTHLGSTTTLDAALRISGAGSTFESSGHNLTLRAADPVNNVSLILENDGVANFQTIDHFRGTVTVNSGGDLTFLDYHLPSGQLQVEGNGTTLAGRDLRVGWDPYPVITGESAALSVGNQATISLTGRFEVGGVNNDADAALSGGATITSDVAQVSDGELALSGSGTLLTTAELTVGSAFGSGVLTIDQGAAAQVNGMLYIEHNALFDVITASAAVEDVRHTGGGVYVEDADFDFDVYDHASDQLHFSGNSDVDGFLYYGGYDPAAGAPGGTSVLVVDTNANLSLSHLTLGGYGNDAEADLLEDAYVGAYSSYIGYDVEFGSPGNGRLTLEDNAVFEVLSTVVVGSDPGSLAGGEVSVMDQATLQTGSLYIFDTGTFNLLGGTLETYEISELDGEFNWYLGTVSLLDDAVLTPGFVDMLLASTDGQLNPGQTLSIDGQATLLTPLTLNGGVFEYGSLVNGHLLSVNSGSVAVNSQFFVTLGGDMGRVVIVEDYQLNPALNIYVEQDGVLQVRGTGEVIAGNIIELRGRVQMFDGTSYLRADGINISGVLSGTGYVLADGEFAGDGNIYIEYDGEVRATDGEHLILDTAHIANGGTFYAHDAIIEVYSQDGDGLELFNAPPFDDPEGGESGPGGHIILLDGGQLIMHEGELWNEGQVSIENAILRVPELSNHNDGVATFSGEETKLFGDLYLGEDARITISSETRAKFFDYAELEGDLFIGEGGLAIFFSDVEGSFDVSGNGGVEIHGDFSPGSSPGSVNIAGDLDLSASRALRLEIAGDVQGDDYDFVNVGGRLTLGGELRIVLLEEWSAQAGEPAPGSRVDLLDWSILSGSFEDVSFEDDTDFFANSGLGINLQHLYTTGELSFELLGDVNTDGFVGVEDLDLLLAHWGDSVNPYDYAAGDLTGDGLVGDADLQLVLTYWGDGTPPDVNIPEPGTATLFAMTGLALLRRRR